MTFENGSYFSAIDMIASIGSALFTSYEIYCEIYCAGLPELSTGHVRNLPYNTRFDIHAEGIDWVANRVFACLTVNMRSLPVQVSALVNDFYDM